MKIISFLIFISRFFTIPVIGILATIGFIAMIPIKTGLLASLILSLLLGVIVVILLLDSSFYDYGAVFNPHEFREKNNDEV